MFVHDVCMCIYIHIIQYYIKYTLLLYSTYTCYICLIVYAFLYLYLFIGNEMRPNDRRRRQVNTANPSKRSCKILLAAFKHQLKHPYFMIHLFQTIWHLELRIQVHSSASAYGAKPYVLTHPLVAVDGGLLARQHLGKIPQIFFSTSGGLATFQ